MSLASRLMIPRLRGAPDRVDTDNRTLGAVRILALCAAASIAALAAPVAERAGRRAASSTSGGARPERGPYIEGSVSFLRVRDAAGSDRARRELGAAPPLAGQAPAPGGPLPPDELRAPCERQLLAARPTDRPLLAPDHDHRPRAHRRSRDRATCARLPPAGPGARPALFPPPERVRAARRFLAHRAGIVAWALIDSHGRMHGMAPGRTFISASLVKAMLLVAYLRELGNRPPSARRAGAPRPDDHEVRQQARDRGLRPCRRRRPAGRSPLAPGCGASR